MMSLMSLTLKMAGLQNWRKEKKAVQAATSLQSRWLD